MLRIVDDGDYAIPWEIHAENLTERATGELALKIVTHIDEGSPIRTLDELLATARKGDEDSEES